jgi:hypothetical protein
MPFKPGESGNPDGRPKDYKFLAALNRAIAQDEGKKLRSAAEKLLALASAGEPWAVKELADRLDGKPKQTVEGGGEGGKFVHSVELTIVDSAG